MHLPSQEVQVSGDGKVEVTNGKIIRKATLSTMQENMENHGTQTTMGIISELQKLEIGTHKTWLWVSR